MISPPYTRFIRVKIYVPPMRGIKPLGWEEVRGGPDGSPLRGGGALGPNAWYPTIQGPPEEKRPNL